MSTTQPSSTVRLALVQSRHRNDSGGNVDHAIEQIDAAADDGADVIALQELFNTCYPCQSEDHRFFDLAESIPGPTIDRIAEVARRRSVVVVAPIFERRAAGVYHNSAAVIDADGSIAGVYRKMHIPDDPLYYEKFYFTPGDFDPSRDSGFQPIGTRYAKLGVGICWDQWFPEAARLFALAGAEILIYPTAIGWIDDEKSEYGATQHDAWQTTMRAHAIANGCFVAAPNRVGVQGRVEFWGGSFIAGPNGEIMASAGHDIESIVTADCVIDRIDGVRTHWPFLRDRRVDAYADLARRMRD